MLVSKSCLLLAIAVPSFAWAPSSLIGWKKSTVLFGYLDDLNTELRGPIEEEEEGELDRESMNLEKEKVANYGVGDWSSFVDFDEFDGGDGQMGVAGDGKKGLDAEWKKEAHFAKSQARSAKNAWGTSTGYADSLIEQGVETSRAQQLENWQNQQELRNARTQHRSITDQFESQQSPADEDWRQLSKFGVERNEEFDLDESFGAVTPGPVNHHVELQSRVNRAEVFEFNLLNSFMGYSDFRARFTPETPGDWTVEPTEGSLSGKKGTDFVVKYRPSNPGVATGNLVIQTEDDKWTFQLTGHASM
mmetsp:Transcript_9693/g.12801  ORF Transcript_9693/g.12801 Transcript_9693/m.12801 type:complete len:304 (+) Transcript_9693:71-982(+)|eukprot:CAMPEP_0198153318 /NCGR_PEP_ID=MMETSP1443-20131203/63589_1 /TAXON_ID=186043 /ORGANISM="Entomoneis sp., Strain CCMP2396" /LENGTH=303 /DNA_ID=CAMNT_0043819609 /DNA_START=638 /DNA_END=1549 /DNA_ORIENTATION=+